MTYVSVRLQKRFGKNTLKSLEIAHTESMGNVWASPIARVRARHQAVAAESVSLAERLLTWGLYTAVAVTLVQTIGDLYDWLATDLRIILLNADDDRSIYPWIPTTAIFMGALALFLQNQLKPVTGFRRWLPLVLAYLSLDEMVALHEHVVNLTDWLGIGASHGRLIWPALYMPLMAVTAIALWRMARDMVPRAERFIRAALVMLATAVVLEIISKFLVDNYPNAYQVEVIVEQNLELAGWTLLGAALLSTFVRRFVRADGASV